MFVGCFEISLSVIVNEHVQSIGTIRAFCLPGRDLLRFSVPGGTEEIAGMWFARGGLVPRLTI